jgi:rhodanese-related sulfurtransferase
MRLARVGYDHTVGYLAGGMAAWEQAGKPVEQVLSVSAVDFENDHWNLNLCVIDIRRPGEYETAHIADVPNKPLDYINDWITSLDRDKTYYIHCAGGYRSMIAASIMKARGFRDVIDIAGGYGAIAKTGLPKASGVEVNG